MEYRPWSIWTLHDDFYDWKGNIAMITLKDFFEVVDYRITEGSDYGWDCYGYSAYCLDSWNGDQDGHSLSVIFDTKTQVVYEVQAHDYANNRAYRIINPEFKAAHSIEAQSRSVAENEAWDDLSYVDLETDEDFLEKARAIVAGEYYDTRVDVPLTLEKEQMYDLMVLAHEADMTLNEFVEKVLREQIDRLQQSV